MSRKKHPGGINLSHRVGVGSSLKNLKRKLVSRTLASDPEALRWALFKHGLYQENESRNLGQDQPLECYWSDG